MPIEGREFYIGRGAKTVTVNICDQNNRRGDYDWIVRLFRPEDVTGREVEAQETISELINWLKTVKGGQIEKTPPGPAQESLPVIVPPAPDEDWPWIERAVGIVEQSLDELVFEFLRVPYLHRVEHSLHARLFAILAAQPHLSGELPLSDGTLTQPIHKEWPETVPSPATRRGNFDLVILSPALLHLHRVDTFRAGNIPAPIVIELGLDYGAAHLAQDAEKLIQSQVRHGYLVHFTRRKASDKEIELIRDPGDRTKVAFASSAHPGQFKLVNGPDVEAV